MLGEKKEDTIETSKDNQDYTMCKQKQRLFLKEMLFIVNYKCYW